MLLPLPASPNRRHHEFGLMIFMSGAEGGARLPPASPFGMRPGTCCLVPWFQ